MFDELSENYLLIYLLIIILMMSILYFTNIYTCN